MVSSIDKEKVIKEFELFIKEFHPACTSEGVELDMLREVLSMLKEQEAVEPTLEQDSMVCGVCGHNVVWQKMLGEGIWADEELDYCPHCGRKVKWE